MTQITRKEPDDRIAYLAHAGGASLPPQERAGLDELARLLSDPAVWEQPGAGLEDSIVAAIREASRTGPTSARD